MNGIAHDGTPLQAGTESEQTELTGQHAHFSIGGLREAVVIDRRFVDEQGNRSRSYVEYTCRDLATPEVYPNCRRVSMMGGLDNGDCDVLRPATNLRPGALGRMTKTTPAARTDGDRVLLGFVEGSRNRAVILGVIAHSGSAYGATKADGDRRLTLHNGMRIVIDKNGQYIVEHKSGSYLKFLDNGDIELHPKGNLLLAGAAAVATDGVLNGSAIDPWTGMTHAALQNASTKVFTKK